MAQLQPAVRTPGFLALGAFALITILDQSMAPSMRSNISIILIQLVHEGTSHTCTNIIPLNVFKFSAL